MQLNICGKPLLRLEGPKAIEASKPKPKLSSLEIIGIWFLRVVPFAAVLVVGLIVGMVTGANMKMAEIRETVRENHGTLVLSVSMLPYGNPVAESANTWDLDTNKIIPKRW